jgi:hypothetical protein
VGVRVAARSQRAAASHSGALVVVGVGTVGWRVHRRYGVRGVATLVVTAGLMGHLRDWFDSLTTLRGALTFDGGIWPHIAHLLILTLLFAVASTIQIAFPWETRHDGRAQTSERSADLKNGTNG